MLDVSCGSGQAFKALMKADSHGYSEATPLARKRSSKAAPDAEVDAAQADGAAEARAENGDEQAGATPAWAAAGTASRTCRRPTAQIRRAICWHMQQWLPAVL